MDNNTFIIPENRYYKLVEKLAKLEKKAIKIGVETPRLTIIGEELIPHPKKNNVMTKVYTIEIFNPTIKYAGWEFIATVQHEEKGNILRFVSDIPIPEQYKYDSPTCEHCNKIRYRKDTYIVKNESEEFKRVGRSCLQDFTGHSGVNSLAAYLEALFSFQEEIKEYDDLMGLEDYADYNYINPVIYMSYVSFCCRKKGWVSRTKSQEQGGVDTSSLALTYMENPKHYNVEIEDEDYESGKKSINWAQQISKQEMVDNNYLYNLGAISQKEGLTYRDLGFFASIFPAYKKSLEIKSESSEYFGKIGERKIFKLKLNYMKTIEGIFGNTFLYKFEDENGNIAIWFASRYQEDLKENTWYNVKATIKSHEEYKGIKQTGINRCKCEIFAPDLL